MKQERCNEVGTHACVPEFHLIWFDVRGLSSTIINWLTARFYILVIIAVNYSDKLGDRFLVIYNFISVNLYYLAYYGERCTKSCTWVIFRWNDGRSPSQKTCRPRWCNFYQKRFRFEEKIDGSWKWSSGVKFTQYFEDITIFYTLHL